MLGDQIGGERDQQADQDVRSAVVAEAPREQALGGDRAPGDGDAQPDPDTAIHAKVSPAWVSENAPVSAAATAKRRQTRPEASLSSDSPNMCIIRLGIGTFCAMAETAIGSVGDTTAASAKATA